MKLMLTTNKTYVNIVLETRKKTIQEGEQNMKTLALQKIRERADFLLGRIKHRAIQYNDCKLSFEEFIEYKKYYQSQFRGYVLAFLDFEVITDEERVLIMREFNMRVLDLKKEI